MAAFSFCDLTPDAAHCIVAHGSSVTAYSTNDGATAWTAVAVPRGDIYGMAALPSGTVVLLVMEPASDPGSPFAIKLVEMELSADGTRLREAVLATPHWSDFDHWGNLVVAGDKLLVGRQKGGCHMPFVVRFYDVGTFDFVSEQCPAPGTGTSAIYCLPERMLAARRDGAEYVVAWSCYTYQCFTTHAIDGAGEPLRRLEYATNNRNWLYSIFFTPTHDVAFLQRMFVENAFICVLKQTEGNENDGEAAVVRIDTPQQTWPPWKPTLACAREGSVMYAWTTTSSTS